MKAMDQLVREQPFFTALPDQHIALIAGCATNVRAEPGEYLFRIGDPAERFFVVRHGRVALELRAPGTGHHVLDTVEAGGVVGWSWLVPPHRWFLDARAVIPTSMIGFDGVCLRAKCDGDPALGYAFMKLVTGVMYQRLQSARVRLLDLYGDGRAVAR